jgi:hypothetical protein
VAGCPLPAFNSLTASAQIVKPLRRLAPKYETWQTELWDYYDRLGEYADGIGWLAKTMSRVRLCAAEVVPGGDEPQRIEEGPAAEAVQRLAGGTAGQAELMKESTIHLSVPGEGWLVGERGISEDRMIEEGLVDREWWSMRSADEIKVSTKRDDRGRPTFEVRDEEAGWRPISADSIVLRLWDPHPRFGWEADSAGRHARGAMLKLDMLNKRIIATIVSRLAGNGILVYDMNRLSVPENKGPTEDADENEDPFARMLVEAAARGIADPVSAEAVIPMPLGADIGDGERFDPELILRHVTFSNPLDEKLMDLREGAVRELARSLDMPADVMLGLADVNHWTAWQIDESGTKIHVSPKAETVVHGLTKGYLVPTLKAADAPLFGPNGGRIVVWYDTSEITQRPDRSANMVLAYDRFEVNGTALRREIGADDDDKPTPAQLREMVIKQAARQPATLLTALQILGEDVPAAPGESEQEVAEEPPDVDRPADGPPDTQDEPPPPPDDDVDELAAAATVRRSVLVPAGAAHPNRATRARRNGTRTAEPAE